MVAPRTYINSEAGAPPLPPPGGYAGATRAKQIAASSGKRKHANAQLIPRPNMRPHKLGIIALVCSIIFALTLIMMLRFASTGIFFTGWMIFMQVAVATLIIFALFLQQARRLAAVALSICLICNLATAASVSAVQLAAGNHPAVERSPQQQRDIEYPGVPNRSPQQILQQPSLEEFRDDLEAATAAVRAELSAQYGLTWVKTDGGMLQRTRNGKGGQSLLYKASFPTWTSEQQITDMTLKEQLFATARQVLEKYGYSDYSPQNTHAGYAPEARKQLFGGMVPAEQALWWAVAMNHADGITNYIDLSLLDLSLDHSGEMGAAAAAQRKNPQDPISGFMVSAYLEPVLSKDDIKEFKERIATDY